MNLGRDADELQPLLAELIGDDVVLGQRRRLAGFIDAQLQLERPAGGVVHRSNVFRKVDRVLDGAAIFHRAAHRGLFVDRERAAIRRAECGGSGTMSNHGAES